MKVCHICNMNSGKHLLGCWSVEHIKDVEQQLDAANATITEQAATIEAMKLCWNCKFIEADRCNKHNCLIDYPMREKCDKWQVREGQ